MARIKLTLPLQFIFSTEMEIRISDINYTGHLGNDAVLSLTNEARIRFLESYGFNEQNVEGKGLIMTEAVVEYKHEAWREERLVIEIAIDDINRLGFNLFYKLTNAKTQKDIAYVRTGMTFFDYQTRKITSAPKQFLEKFVLI